MPNYCVSVGANAHGDHEVHDMARGACANLPEAINRKLLGWHPDCHAAIEEAKKIYPQCNGCYYCCGQCNKG